MITKDIFANYEQCTECQSTLQNEFYIDGMYFYTATKQRTVKSLYYCLIVTNHFIQTIFETWRENATVTDRLPDRFASRTAYNTFNRHATQCILRRRNKIHVKSYHDNNIIVEACRLFFSRVRSSLLSCTYTVQAAVHIAAQYKRAN